MHGPSTMGGAVIGGLVLALSLPASAGDLDHALVDAMNQAAPGEIVSALVYVRGHTDVVDLEETLAADGWDRTARHFEVVTLLRDTADVTQADLVAHLRGLEKAGRVDSFESFWIGNIIRVDAPPRELRRLAAHRDVERIYLNHEVVPIRPVEWAPVPANAGSPGGVENGVEAVRAPEAWALGYDGTGVLVSNVDTGVAGNHPALASRWAGLDSAYTGHPEWAWNDPHFNNNSFPYDDGGHGSHTMGTICGGAPGDQIGVAPGAKWIAAGAIDRPGATIPTTVANVLESFQWIVDPDGNAATAWDVPMVCSNSWGLADFHGYPDCDDLFWTPLDGIEAAGCIIVFAAGNEGFGGLRRPADRATTPYSTLAVAALDAHDPDFEIAGFSSRGPTICTPNGTLATKPDIAAPGVTVRSSGPGGGYYNSSGTSMACPHIAGVIALIRQAAPNLTSNQVKQIMYDTAVDLGEPGEDNTYGYGLVDALEAVQSALALSCTDFNGDNVVDVVDLLQLVGEWGFCFAGCAEDINNDSWVDVTDLLILMGAWGPCQ